MAIGWEKPPELVNEQVAYAVDEPERFFAGITSSDRCEVLDALAKSSEAVESDSVS